ncbi:hypothetical protein SAMN05216573_1347 [Bradyrhizobium sp. Rc3b]|uniref:hypothetical protein n=1 Tax=Bradyrhizobium sp. Rc3b TaxID=1855322 RepID=UPI0008E9C652|nr:hypothetical protein [Bradyrhizobium sp. Rc3b]SFN96481.1 hypothetical protein SAMN05216573_1347 [Bradyrhizobium sp. Rc3b]
MERADVDGQPIVDERYGARDDADIEQEIIDQASTAKVHDTGEVRTRKLVR